VTVGIIACVEVTTTTVVTTPQTTSTSAPTTETSSIAPITSATSLPATTSGTTVLPTSVETTTICQKDMARVGGVYVSSVVYSVEPLPETNNADLTSTTGGGVSFPSVPDTTGLFDANNRPLYNIIITFNPAGVDSFSTLIVNPGTNVDKFAIQFYVPSYPNQPFTFAPEFADIPLSYNSTIVNSRPSIMYFPPQVPSPISGIRISILSTTDNK